MTKMEDGTFDDHTMCLKEKTMMELIEKYPEGLVINDKGGMRPIIDGVGYDMVIINTK